jgi:hypothetical protein
VFVDQQKLAQLGLSIDVVTRRIRAENVNLSGGRLEQGTQRFLVRTLNEFESVEQMAKSVDQVGKNVQEAGASSRQSVAEAKAGGEALSRAFNGMKNISGAMNGMAGLIHSADDFGVNSAGIMITETTISKFVGFDPKGVPEFVRARKAMQYAGSVDDFARIMREGNNGGYANTWLVADRKNNEIASLELGLKNVVLQRTRMDSCRIQFPNDAKLMREETDFDPSTEQEQCRHDAGYADGSAQGKINEAAAQKFWATMSTVLPAR